MGGNRDVAAESRSYATASSKLEIVLLAVLHAQTWAEASHKLGGISALVENTTLVGVWSTDF